MLRFKCPKCDTAYRALDGADGRETVCRVCGHKFVAQVYNDLQPTRPRTIPLAPIEDPTPKNEEITRLAASEGNAERHSNSARRIVMVRSRTNSALIVAVIPLLGVLVGAGALWYGGYLKIPGLSDTETSPLSEPPPDEPPRPHRTSVYHGTSSPDPADPGSLSSGKKGFFDHSTGGFSSRYSPDDPGDGTPQDNTGRNDLKYKVKLEKNRSGDAGHQTCVVGEVINQTRRALRRVELRVSFLDSDGREIGAANEVLTHLPVGMATPIRVVLAGAESESVDSYQIGAKFFGCPANVAVWRIPGSTVSVLREGSAAVVTGRATYFDAGSVKGVKIYCDLYIGNDRVGAGEGQLLIKKVLRQGDFDTFIVRIPRVPRSGDLTALCRARARRQ